jgi:altronate hydrolase
MATHDLRAKALILHPDDDVVIARAPIPVGTVLDHGGERIEVQCDIRPGHKVARRARGKGEAVRRYGQVIGFATQAIAQGEHVHTHNLAVGDYNRGYEVGVDVRPVDYYPAAEMRYFDGFKRADGRVGTRNYVAVISTVNCSASVCQFIRERFRDVQRDFPNVDGVIAITHKSGCGTSFRRGPRRALRVRRLRAHPNVSAYLLIGPGAGQPTVPLIERQWPAPRPPIRRRAGCGRPSRRVSGGPGSPAGRQRGGRRGRSELILATNCGGSDGNSGITANPALGWAVDELVRYGGTGVLAENSEIYGAEHLLIRRAVDEGVAKKLIDRFKWWEYYCRVLGAEMDNNPAPGNKAGGLTTVFEKSLGGVTKGGTTPLTDVFLYGEPITTRGFVFMDTPGHDPVSVTALVAGGSNIVVFTTGRGSVFGCRPVPSIKLATNSLVYRQMEEDMDINCGVILEGTPLETVGRQVFEEVVAVASGRKTKSEAQGIGEEEFAPWIIGPVL